MGSVDFGLKRADLGERFFRMAGGIHFFLKSTKHQHG
jgi:hypothetical protein